MTEEKPIDAGWQFGPHEDRTKDSGVVVGGVLGVTSHRVASPTNETSLRDYFAGQIICGIGAWVPPRDYCEEAGTKGKSVVIGHGIVTMKNAHELRARWAYAGADAMLKARVTEDGY